MARDTIDRLSQLRNSRALPMRSGLDALAERRQGLYIGAPFNRDVTGNQYALTLQVRRDEFLHVMILSSYPT